YDRDKTELLADLTRSREMLLSVVEQLGPQDFERARRGSWPISKILDHVLHSERLYTQLISTFSRKPAVVIDAGGFTTASEAALALRHSRDAFLVAVDKVTEKDFYQLQKIGHEEYSVLSILENNASHDREHAEQIGKTFAGP